MIGELYINGYDAFETWGIDFEDGAVSALMTPSPMKEYITSDNRMSHGKTVLTANARYDSREVLLPFHLLAKSKAEFFTRYDAFCASVLASGGFTMYSRFRHKASYAGDNAVRIIPTESYKLVYVSCSQFRQFDSRMGVFSLKVTEPNPADRPKVYPFPFRLHFSKNAVAQGDASTIDTSLFAVGETGSVTLSNPASWCHASYSDNVLSVWVNRNSSGSARTTSFTITKGNASATIEITQAK